MSYFLYIGIMKTIKYCPQCVLPLVKDKRKLGRYSKSWVICPNCGYREHENTPYFDKLDEENTNQALENMNSRNYE